MSDKRQQLSILDQWASQSGQVSRSTERLSEIAEWIDWEPLYAVGRRLDKTGPQGGQPRKPVKWMIRGLFLQRLYQLSDPQLEDQLIDRLSFRRFAGLPLDQKVPDFTTFWRFREQLAAEGYIDELFSCITRQLEAKGLILKRGTVVDAALIASAGRPLGEDKRQALAQDPSPQIDTDADSPRRAARGILATKVILGWMWAASLFEGYPSPKPPRMTPRNWRPCSAATSGRSSATRPTRVNPSKSNAARRASIMGYWIKPIAIPR